MLLLRRILEWAWVLLLVTDLLLRYVCKVDMEHYHFKDIWSGITSLWIIVSLYLFICKEFFPAKDQPANPG